MSGVGVAPFGRLPDGRPVQLFTLTNRNGLVARLTNYGATLTELHTPDRAGTLADIILGYPSLDGYLHGTHYFGSTVGRVANRITGARFTLDGQVHQLEANDPPNHLHGGRTGFDKVLWHAEALPGVSAVRCEYVSPDGEEGYPGRLETAVVFTLTDADELAISYSARTDQATPVNLTNHAYFNLAGAGDILGHELTLMAGQYTPTNDRLLPSGAIVPVQGTPYDFTTAHAIGERIAATGAGYDHNFVVSGAGGLVPVARVAEPGSGRVLELSSTMPGVQLYTGNFLNGERGKGGQQYPRHGGFTLETQGYPDAVNQAAFPSIILRPGATWRHQTTFRFPSE
jgi:aldose 1-epimerase